MSVRAPHRPWRCAASPVFKSDTPPAGINYSPNEYLLDPRYAPPQQYIMSTSTPRAPPAPVAALLSPVLWRLNSPDK